MNINVKALINSLGKNYQEIFNKGLNPYKIKLSGFSGDEVICLEMVKEGGLAFYREGMNLK
ncbi:DUF6392 family protein [Photorhabdus sp. RW14-46]|uniref:DUF6392 family protein n=1 Tax=Photorhabdus sp. RW14-46 TaxID=2100168 RepID=UPI001A98DE15